MHVVGGGEVEMEISKLHGGYSEFPYANNKERSTFILNWESPVTTAVLSHNMHLLQYASIASPITDLTRKLEPSKVKWSPSCEIAFRKLKEALLRIPETIHTTNRCFRQIEEWEQY